MKYGHKPLDAGLALRPNLLTWLPDKPASAWNPSGDATALRAWQARARKKFLACLGDPLPAVDLRPRTLERKQLDGYTRTLLTLDTAPNLKALCWLCVPDGSSDASPGPAMLATPGHGMGAKDLLAMDKHGRPRPEGEGYQRDYALQAVRLGYTTLVVEPLGFGERRDPDMMTGKSTESGCHAAATMALMLGTTLGRIRLNDLQRALDYLQTLPGVLPDRIGMMGISGGGTMTLWTAAVDTRVKAAIVSGYVNTFRDSVMAMQHCICNFAPGLAREFDMADLAAMLAPRPLLLQSGTHDKGFPIRGASQAIAKIKKAYAAANAADHLAVNIFDGKHQWSPRKSRAF